MALPNNTDYSHGENQGMIMQQLKTLEEGQKLMVVALDSFKERMGERLGTAEKNIEKINGEMGIVMTIGRWIFMPIFSVLGMAILAILGWHFYHRIG